MKLAIFDDLRLGLVRDDRIFDVTSAVPGWDADSAGNWWVRLCRDLDGVRPALEAAATGEGRALREVRLQAPVLNPSKIIAAASNYGEHVTEMLGARGTEAWQFQFDVFLKAPSSIIGPDTPVWLPPVGDAEVHHESELAVVIGKGGRCIPEDRALEHVLGYTIALDMTVRGEGDRSRRKSYDGFTPVGPWVVTRDEIDDPHDLDIKLWVNGQLKQDVNTRDMMTRIPGIIAYASAVMTLNPGDLISTGAPPGVGKVVPGDRLHVQISQIGEYELPIG